MLRAGAAEGSASLSIFIRSPHQAMTFVHGGFCPPLETSARGLSFRKLGTVLMGGTSQKFTIKDATIRSTAAGVTCASSVRG